MLLIVCRRIVFTSRIIGCMLNAAKLEKVRKDFGLRVRALRTKRGFSQEDFADECGLHRTYIGAIERGERNVSINNIAKIADALKVDMGDLF